MSGGALPNAFIIGAQKAGTTALQAYLGEHPDVFACVPKEPHFFSRNYDRGLEWYESLFADGAARKVRLEGSTTYSMYPMGGDCAGRIAAAVPDARIIYLLRDPVDRMRSAYHHALSTGRESRDIGQALLYDARYLHASSYALQLERYLRVFDRSQILCLRYEDFAVAPDGVVDAVLAFLRLDVGWRPARLGARFNESRGRRVPRPWWLSMRRSVQRFAGQRADQLVARVNTASPLVSRAIGDDEVRMPDPVRVVIDRLLQDDLARLGDLIGSQWSWPARS